MVDSARIREFRDRWEHGPTPTQEFERFRVRMLEVTVLIWNEYFRHYPGVRKRFAIVSGTEFSGNGDFYNGGLSTSIREATTSFEIIEAIQCMLWTMETDFARGLESCCHMLRDAFSLSPSIMVQLVEHDGKVSLYPTGARMLDEALVESNLAWLGRYPKAQKPFEDALKSYLTKDPNQYRHMLDSLRCSVEQMLRSVLKNEKSLENQKEEFLKWLAKHDAHSHIVGMYNELVFNRFAKYQNDAVKHQEDKYTPAEVEFVLYLTGTFLRFVQRLAEEGAVLKKTTKVS